ncbi:SOS response-associated peptidase family protein [Flavobacterium sp. SORGH_AS_0622]|uniref:SOS response-associated peptidase family protein n=1 Tax=Flavobacterium sp. SORGH_AS_0622 TaxID=3041772 RepID=UPI002785054C|nr:SOS response-associated peptidase family protein [Flavobacterium sp. SORGH_AS_0622]MDQ1165896.1 putative SOS response-associated peptidase YedK [Flavobacterium sp. SORGH_AS_0622]
MCYYVDQKGSRRDVKIRFNIAINDTGKLYNGVFVKGFDYPNLPIISNDNPKELTTNLNWGLMPSWAGIGLLEFRKGKLNARIEELNEKPSYRNIIENRCLIIISGYYE